MPQALDPLASRPPAAPGAGPPRPGPDARTVALVILAALATIAALSLLRAILVPIVTAVILAVVLAPSLTLVRRVLPVGATGAAVILFLLAVMLGLYGASLAADSLFQAASSLPGEISGLTRQVSQGVNDLMRDHPSLRALLPEPMIIDRLGDRNSFLLGERLTSGLTDLSGWVAQGFIVLILVLFLLAEGDLLIPRVIRFFARSADDHVSEQTLKVLTRQLRSYLLARTAINLGLGLVVAGFLWAFGVRFPLALGLFAGATNFVPYVGQVLGGGLPALATLTQGGSVGDALIVGSFYLAAVTVEGYVVTPFILGRSLDLNGTVILVACLFWGYLWGLVGLILAMPITACVKLVCQSVPELHRWAHLMSRDWEPPEDGVAPGE